MAAEKCIVCRQLIESSWLEDGRCHGCRKEFKELGRWRMQITCDRDQLNKPVNRVTRAQWEVFGKRADRKWQRSD